MRISDWSSDVCSSDLRQIRNRICAVLDYAHAKGWRSSEAPSGSGSLKAGRGLPRQVKQRENRKAMPYVAVPSFMVALGRSEEHTSELQSLMRISYAVFCLKKKNRSDATRPRLQQISKHKHVTHNIDHNDQQGRHTGHS